MTKQDKIKEAYSEEFRISGTKEEDLQDRYNAVSPALDLEYGWFEGNLHNVDKNRLEFSGYECRSQPLIGLDNNNGWNKISEVGHPKTEQYVDVFVDRDIVSDVLYKRGGYERCYGSSEQVYYETFNPTHWREIDERKPLY